MQKAKRFSSVAVFVCALALAAQGASAQTIEGFCPSLTLDLSTTGIRHLSQDMRQEYTDQVSQLQEFLAQYPAIYPEGIVSGIFGRLTENAVKRFQREYRISQTGLVGPLTRAKISSVCSGVSNVSSIAILSPVKNQRMRIGGTYQISWKAAKPGKVNIFLSSLSSPIGSNVDAQAGSIDWIVPSSLSPSINYFIRIEPVPRDSSVVNGGVVYQQINIIPTAPDPEFVDVSPRTATMSINGDPVNYTLQIKNNNTINLTGVSVVANLTSGQTKKTLEQQLNCGASVAVGALLTGQNCMMTMPISISTQDGFTENSRADIVFSLKSGADVYDSYRGFVTIGADASAQSIEIMSPVKNQRINIGNSYQIQWRATKPGNVKISLVRHPNIATPLYTIKDSIDAKAESFDWAVPSTLSLSVNYNLRIEQLPIDHTVFNNRATLLPINIVSTPADPEFIDVSPRTATMSINGDPVNYTLQIKNNNNINLTGVIVEAVIIKGQTIVKTTEQNISCGASVASGILPAGSTCSMIMPISLGSAQDPNMQNIISGTRADIILSLKRGTDIFDSYNGYVTIGVPDIMPPTVSISASPSVVAGQIYSAGHILNIDASVSDNTGGSGVARVDFMRNGVVVQSDSRSPFKHSWTIQSGIIPGSYTLVAVAYDNAGNASARSNNIDVTVGTTPILVPTYSVKTLDVAPSPMQLEINGAVKLGSVTVQNSGTTVPGNVFIQAYIDQGSVRRLASSENMKISCRTTTGAIAVSSTIPLGTCTAQIRLWAYDADETTGTGKFSPGDARLIIELRENNNSLFDRFTQSIQLLANPAIKVDLKANGLDGPIQVQRGSSINLTWTSANVGVSVCNPSGAWGYMGRQDINNLVGTSIGPLTNNSIFTITCGTVSDSVTVNMLDTTSPIVSMSISPSVVSGKIYPVGETFDITAVASDNAEGSGVSRVDFLKNGLVIGTDNQSPYRYSWTIPVGTLSGSYAFNVVAYDNAGNVSVRSNSVTILVGVPPEPVLASSIKILDSAPSPVSLQINGAIVSVSVSVQNNTSATTTGVAIQAHLYQGASVRRYASAYDTYPVPYINCRTAGRTRVSPVGAVPPGSCIVTLRLWAADYDEASGTGMFTPGSANLIIELKQNNNRLEWFTQQAQLTAAQTSSSARRAAIASMLADLSQLIERLNQLMGIQR